MEAHKADYGAEDGNDTSGVTQEGLQEDAKVLQEDFPAPAPDDTDTWSAMTDVALRHISRVSSLFMHPQDLESAELTWPEDLSRHEPTAEVLTPTYRVVLVNQDAHIPTHARHPNTAPYILQAISDLYPALAKRPSSRYTPYARIWRCPYDGCGYFEDLARLSHAAGEAVCRVAATAVDSYFLTNDLASDYIKLVEGRYCARREFIKNVVDIIGLRHYESHLSQAGLRCSIRGQRPSGYLSFMWEHADMDAMLQSNSVEGVQARRHEEAARKRFQLALRAQARCWAHETRFWEMGGLTAERQSARSLQHAFVKTLDLSHVLTDGGRHFSQLRELEPRRSLAVLAAGRKLHDDVYGAAAERETVNTAITSRLLLANEEIESWERGDGLFLTLDRGDSPELYIH
ncbi:unnamed protein product [Peniophora sp. CBMAI 1063]|nr:unnamed protein product [Peniophora sp. CBMAI 1063]